MVFTFLVLINTQPSGIQRNLETYSTPANGEAKLPPSHSVQAYTSSHTHTQARNQGGSVGSYESPPRDHVGPLGPFFLYVFRKLDCHNFSLLFKMHEI